jgi:hypothetical protein
LDAVTFAVFREDFQRPWGADGDHLKTQEDIKYALDLGYTMITLDCSEFIAKDIPPANAAGLDEKYRVKYLDKQFDIGEGIVLQFTESELKVIAAVYSKLIDFAAYIYNCFFKNDPASAKTVYNADLEISIDETTSPTTVLEHYFIASELLDAGVLFASLAPRFCGEFQKGIDYCGDIAQFKKEIKAHAVIARHFGYKLSIHSGSDQFSVFPFISRECRGVFHVKTAGTNWLEAMRVIALKDPALYREVHKYALTAFEEACNYYHVSADISEIPDVDSLSDSDLPLLFENNNSRQLIHITYGLILNKKNPDDSYSLKNRLYKVWHENEEAYALALGKHIGRHLDLLNVPFISTESIQ